MQKEKEAKKKNILFLFVCIHFFMIIYCGCFWGKEFFYKTRQNLVLKFYDGILEWYIPEIQRDNTLYKENWWSALCRTMIPSADHGIQLLAQNVQEDERTMYEQKAVKENEEIEKMVTENVEGKIGDIYIESTDGVKDCINEGDNFLGKKVVTINRKKLEDFDYLCQNFYQIDNTTTIGKDQLDVDKLLGVDMSVDMSVNGPEILIYHTHSQENYCDGKEGDDSTSVIAVGDELKALLEKEGFSVLHHKGKYDVGDRDHAYSNAAPELEKILGDNPNIQVVIDLHRDAVPETTHLVTEVNGKQTAQIMFFNGLSRTTTQGDLIGLKNPYIAENLALSFQLELVAKEYYPDLTRRNYLKGYRYNMHMRPKSILVEVGAQNNTYEEAKNAMKPLADILCKVLKKE